METSSHSEVNDESNRCEGAIPRFGVSLRRLEASAESSINNKANESPPSEVLIKTEKSEDEKENLGNKILNSKLKETLELKLVRITNFRYLTSFCTFSYAVMVL